MVGDRKAHWESVFQKRADDELSWYEPRPEHSLELIHAAMSAGARSLIDIGGGTSRLVDALIDEPLDRIAVLDISPTALARTRDRLGSRAGEIEWLSGDVTTVEEIGTFDIWHDRAVFHFLISEADRLRYRDLVERTVPKGGHVVIATFGPQGPEKCSGLNVRRYDDHGLLEEFGSKFSLAHSSLVDHMTPAGRQQQFLYTMLSRRR
jgi:SAM-dependent methyltransferase